MWWRIAIQPPLRFIVRLDVSEQKPSRSFGVNPGGHVGDVAAVALGETQTVKPRPSLRDPSTGRGVRYGLCGSGACHRPSVDCRSASNGRMLASDGCAPNTSAAARRTNGSASLMWLAATSASECGELRARSTSTFMLWTRSSRSGSLGTASSVASSSAPSRSRTHMPVDSLARWRVPAS